MLEITDLSDRFRTVASPGARPIMQFDEGTATPVHRSMNTVARIGRTLAPWSDRLGAVTPSAAAAWSEPISVFVPPAPVGYGNRQSAIDAVAAAVARRLGETFYTYQLGLVGDGAAVMLQADIDAETLSSQYLFIIDTSMQLHEFYYWSR
ncbi:hypothetical protein GCM10009745_49610 [Kribbella yunnanensis]|uniref:Uncharacterized protein n=1 Tax=Kribbella yunnanensis TaxID=190194 RepID=A0ABP4U4Y8_9ACTN